jgi:hypothetical protein
VSSGKEQSKAWTRLDYESFASFPFPPHLSLNQNKFRSWYIQIHVRIFRWGGTDSSIGCRRHLDDVGGRNAQNLRKNKQLITISKNNLRENQTSPT